MRRILQIPARVSGQLIENHSRIYKMILMVLVLITGLYTRDYRGEYQDTINNNAGGVFYVIFGSLVISLLFPTLKSFTIASLSFALTCVVEIVQYFQFPFMLRIAHHKLLAYLFGSSYNPKDFIYYGIGAVCSVLVLVLIRRNEVEQGISPL